MQAEDRCDRPKLRERLGERSSGKIQHVRTEEISRQCHRARPETLVQSNGEAEKKDRRQNERRTRDQTARQSGPPEEIVLREWRSQEVKKGQPDGADFGVPGSEGIEDATRPFDVRSEEHTSELQSLAYLVCRLLLEKKKQGSPPDSFRSLTDA